MRQHRHETVRHGKAVVDGGQPHKQFDVGVVDDRSRCAERGLRGGFRFPAIARKPAVPDAETAHASSSDSDPQSALKRTNIHTVRVREET